MISWTEIRLLKEQMRKAENPTIFDLFEIAGLDPKCHFRGHDWRFVKFDGLDLTGLDLRDARLFGSTFKGASVAETNFLGSDVEYTRLDLAHDWKKAVLSEAQRELIGLKSLINANNKHHAEKLPSIESISAYLSKGGEINEPSWVSLIKAAETFDEAHGYYRLMVDQNIGNNKFALTSLLDKSETPGQVEIVTNYLKKFSVQVDSHLVATLISKAESEFQARQTFDEYRDKVERTHFIYNALIAKIEFYERASDIFEDMERDKIYPDAVTLNPLIWKAESFEGAYWIYKKIKDPRTADLNAVLSKADWSHFMRTVEALELFENGPKPETQTFNIIIGVCKKLDDAMSVKELMDTTNFKPDIYTAFALLSVILKSYELSTKPEFYINKGFGILVNFLNQGINVIVNDVLKKMMQIIENAKPVQRSELERYASSKASPAEALVALAENHASAGLAQTFKEALEAYRGKYITSQNNPPET
jgi:hypothetical protein